MKAKVLKIIRKRTVKQFAAFFLLAFVFLVFSKLSNDYRQDFQIELQLNNLDDDIVLSNDSTNYVTAIVEAKGFAFLPYMFSNQIAMQFNSKSDVINTKEAFVFDVAKHKYMFEEKLGESYIIRSLKPDTIVFEYSKLASKKVPLKLVSDIDFAAGYDLLGDFEFDTDSIKIVGSEDAIASITELQTELLSLTNVNTDIKETLDVEVGKYPDVEIVPKEVSVTGSVSRFTEGTLEIPILITNKPEGVQINVFPKTVSVSFYVDLKRYNDILPSDFIVECEFPNDMSKASYLLPKLTKTPEVVKRAVIKQKRIDFIIL
ncbi:YbbR-like domain-containing protein [Winogradskyella sp. DF17]|uniref:YbbR-like domain-containing protein n=1 Tax=Winogradskyella pelagia TaxID=2819984 RepID=A0ABS3T4K3_9FLAO|nr:YbbR-like domain-containing protein [Winogradskyella sp. DF17]MBO3117364.1 YbbR-like domain-containing protein [Winogradskyella sp. DF17]